jgi:hypothetical protein
MAETLTAEPRVSWQPPPPRVLFQIEESPVEMIRREGLDLLKQHWAEVVQFPETQILDPDWVVYDTLEKTGKLWVLSARHGGRLVGYIVMMLSRHLHYRTIITATDDIHFLHPDYRRGLTGYRMIALTAQAMSARGVKMCTFRTKALNNHGKLFERLGFVQHDVIYAKIMET